jgi:hypothetical protein
VDQISSTRQWAEMGNSLLVNIHQTIHGRRRVDKVVDNGSQQMAPAQVCGVNHLNPEWVVDGVVE